MDQSIVEVADYTERVEGEIYLDESYGARRVPVANAR